jgi:hypothetical protein
LSGKYFARQKKSWRLSPAFLVTMHIDLGIHELGRRRLVERHHTVQRKLRAANFSSHLA